MSYLSSIVTKAHTYNTTSMQYVKFLESMLVAMEGITSETRHERQEEVMELQNRQRIIKRKIAYPQRAINALNTHYILQLKDYKTL